MALPVRTTIADLRADLAVRRAEGVRVALVPTMGALHRGHLALVARAAELADVVVVSIFVNPLQFGRGEDLDAYPRTLDADVAALEGSGASIVFAPPVAEMYPSGTSSTRVTGGAVAGRFEGRSRPGHFDGALTVVLKLLHIVSPDTALFGAKDAQQLFLVERMVRDLDLPVVIAPVATVREDDGLARSSRNRFLDPGARIAARAIPAALEAAASAASLGVDPLIGAAQGALAGESDVDLDYLVVVDPATFEPVGDTHRGHALVLLAARVGGVRLIDNVLVRVG